MPETESLAPEFGIRINGSDLPLKAMADVVTVAVHQDVVAPGMFTLRLITWDITAIKITWADDELFAIGNEVEIQMGYVDDLRTLMVGEVTGLEPEFCADEAPMLTVRGYDRRHRLLRSRKTRSFTQVKDSDIASQIATAAGLKAQAIDTGVTLDYVLQHNQTDLDFLQDRAQRIGYEVVIENKTLQFRPRQHTGSEVLTLDREGELIEFYPRLTTLNQVGAVAVRGWNPKDKQAIIGQAASGDESTQMGGSSVGPAVVNAAFGSTDTASVDRPVFSQAEADQIAQGRFDELALSYITGEGSCIGRTDLRAGVLIGIEGLGRQFSGPYYVTSTTHTYAPERGYRTGFTVRRNAT